MTRTKNKAIEPITMQSVSAFIYEFERNTGDAPSVSEICAHFGVLDRGMVIKSARAGVAAGLLWQDERRRGRYRAVKHD